MRFSDNEKQQFVARYYNGESIADICTETGIARSTFYTWLKSHKITQTETGNIISAAEFMKIKKRLEKLEQKIKVLQTVNCTVSSPLKTKLQELALLHGQYSVHVLCDALEVPRGTFYNHIFRNKKENNSYQFRRTQLSEQIKQIHEESNQIYGAKKIKAILTERGVATSDRMVAELMQEMNLFSIRTDAKKIYNRFKPTEKKDSLKLNFSVKAPNQVWVSDVTYFRLDNKTHFICAILDLYSRKVMACKISQKHSTQLTTSSFRLAYEERRPEPGLIFHSDRGIQYTSFSFQKLLRTCQIEQSFSPSGKPCHNAVMESFFSSLKKEELYRRNYHSITEFKECVQKYIDFYNTERPHSTLDYKTPNAYEALYFARQNQKAS